MTLAVRFRSAEREKQDVEVADHWQKESVMNPDLVCDPALCQRNNGAANDGHDHDSRAIASERSELRHTQRENTRKHDGVEETDEDDTPHGNVSRGQHRDRDQSRGANCAHPEQLSGFDFLQQTGADETTDHRTTPVEGYKTSRNPLCQPSNLGLA